MTADDATPQNVYDDPDFFEAYARLDRFGEVWGSAYEHRAFTALVPDPSGSRVLDLGCGAGQLAFHLAEAGAKEVIALDVSERMLQAARAERGHPAVTYVREAMETASFPEGRFELIVSSLAVHYVADLGALMRRIVRWLVPGGVLVLSTEHPVFLARATEDGWVRDDAGEPTAWAIAHYGEEGMREEHWLRPGVLKYARMISTLLNDVIDAGLTIERVVEPMPTNAQIDEHPEWIHERKRPIFVIVAARKHVL